MDENSIILGIAQDNPSITKPENCRYDTCFVISSHYKIKDDSVSEENVTGGKYGIFRINHTAEAVQKAWIEIFSETAKQGYKIDETRPFFERYKMKMVHNHGCEICVPVH